jgi:ERCC4-related helicase
MNDKIENMESVKFSSNLDIANEIAELASPYLTEQQKAAVATFENDIHLDKIFEYLTFFDLMSPNIQKSYERKYGEFLKSSELINTIRDYLKTCDIESFRQFSARLYRPPEKQNELKNSLSSIMANEYSRRNKRHLNEDIQDEFVSEFLDSIRSLYDMWNHDIWNY